MNLLARIELEHPAFVGQVDLLLTCFVGQREALCQRSGGLGAGVYQKVALRVVLYLLLSRIEVSIEAGDEQDLLLYFVVVGYVKVKVDLLVVLPDIALIFLLVS